jgi:hypothetical protein
MVSRCTFCWCETHVSKLAAHTWIYAVGGRGNHNLARRTLEILRPDILTLPGSSEEGHLAERKCWVEGGPSTGLHITAGHSGILNSEVSSHGRSGLSSRCERGAPQIERGAIGPSVRTREPCMNSQNPQFCSCICLSYRLTHR